MRHNISLHWPLLADSCPSASKKCDVLNDRYREKQPVNLYKIRQRLNAWFYSIAATIQPCRVTRRVVGNNQQ